MGGFLWFLLGSMFGGTVGIVVMCILQVNRLHDDDYIEKE